MTQTLVQLTASVQAMFIDDGTNFNAATCTAAIRQALKDFNVAAPLHAAEIQFAVNQQYDYEISNMDCLQIIDVLEDSETDMFDNTTPLPFIPYFEDGRPWIRLQSPQPNGLLIFRYTIPYTIEGLDGEVESTLSAIWDAVLLDGACYYCCIIRASSRIEQINLNQDVANPWQNIAKLHRIAFENGLTLASRQSFAKVPDKSWSTRTWDDEWHNFLK